MSTPSSLDLKLEEPGDDPLSVKVFEILRDFLQSNAALTLQNTARSILALLPENDSDSMEVLSFSETCIEVAEQIPYHHPSRLKLAGLMEQMGRSTKLGHTYTSSVGLLGSSSFRCRLSLIILRK